MQVEQLADAQEFLTRTADLRAADPVMTNLLGSIATGVASGRTYRAEYWWVVTDDAGAVVGCALRTAPHRLIVSPMPAPAAAALGAAVGSADPDLPGCNGPRPVVAAVGAALAPHRALRVTMTDVVYVLEDYLPPPTCAGGARRAGRADLPLLVAWHVQFGIDAGLAMHDAEGSVLARLEHAGLWLWEVDGAAVSMAGHATPVQTPTQVVGRIGPVFTPADLRGRGYGSAVTAAVIDQLLPDCATVMLFADAENPSSNAIYRRLGFRSVGEVVEAELERPHR